MPPGGPSPMYAQTGVSSSSAERGIGAVCLVVHPKALVLRSDLDEDRDLALSDQATSSSGVAVLVDEGEGRDDSKVGGGR